MRNNEEKQTRILHDSRDSHADLNIRGLWTVLAVLACILLPAAGENQVKDVSCKTNLIMLHTTARSKPAKRNSLLHTHRRGKNGGINDSSCKKTTKKSSRKNSMDCTAMSSPAVILWPIDWLDLQARSSMIPSLKSASVSLRKELFNTDFDSYKLSDDKLFRLEKTIPLRPRVSSSLPFPSDYSATSFR
jgi:hypothetical protein